MLTPTLNTDTNTQGAAQEPRRRPALPDVLRGGRPGLGGLEGAQQMNKLMKQLMS